jgi:hypothetical protein
MKTKKKTYRFVSRDPPEMFRGSSEDAPIFVQHENKEIVLNVMN